MTHTIDAILGKRNTYARWNADEGSARLVEPDLSDVELCTYFSIRIVCSNKPDLRLVKSLSMKGI
jgi:hypothetical protein